MNIPIHYPSFFTATILEWKPFLKQSKFKDIVIDRLEFLVKDNRVEILDLLL